ncbi:hypothetical protein [Bacillus altitudinis]|uniref:hypothetical protein n=1 Tax=Bacillus altitudinis TaxID=293387 RepID=UPI002FFE3AD4
MDELHDKILNRINTDLFDCEMKEDTIAIISKSSEKEYIIEFEEIPELNLNSLLNIVSKIDTLDFLDVDFIEDDKLVTKVRKNSGFEFLMECCLVLELIDTDIKRLEILDEIIKIVTVNSGTYKDLELSIIEEEEIHISSTDWRANARFNVDNLDDALEVIKSFFYGTYIESTAFYEHDYIEFSISFPELENIFGVPHLSEIELTDESIQNKLYFEVNKISEPFFNLKTKDKEYGDEYGYDDYEEITLKIYNINSELQIDLNAEDFYERAQYVAKTIIFDLSYKYDIEIGLYNELEDGEDLEDSIYELSEKLDNVKEKDTLVTKLYDKDLVNYYYRALQMKDSEFKYMAFYQVIECIYDEVLMATTVESIRQLISANGFDSNIDENIKFVIDKIKLHNSSKKDEDKLKLILEKYFKGTLPDEVFLEVNKDIANLLVKMKKIRETRDIKDLQKLQQVIYRFRCDCTHSNRAYPIKRIEDENSLEDYINLIKMVAERIIINYR